jgi:hypothetical protein
MQVVIKDGAVVDCFADGQGVPKDAYPGCEIVVFTRFLDLTPKTGPNGEIHPRSSDARSQD